LLFLKTLLSLGFMVMFAPKNLAIVVPTRNRSKNIHKLLASLLAQPDLPGLIIVVASGEQLDSVIEQDWKGLNILYLHTDVVGQVNQRNLGLEKAFSYPLIACLDDDIELLPGSLNALLDFWNTHPEKDKIAAVGFNIQNLPSSRDSWLKRKLLGIPETPGLILPCGVATPIANIEKNIKTQWVNGGTTVWRRDVLIESQNTYQLRGKAYAEDVFFSYPLSKKYAFYIAVEARVLHHDLYLSTPQSFVNRFWSAYREEIRITQARLYLVRSHATLSEAKLLSFWFHNACLKLVAGLAGLSPKLLGAAMGSFQSLLTTLLGATKLA
jgi:glycosyltransferase involved in cell wall biosynthesis